MTFAVRHPEVVSPTPQNRAQVSDALRRENRDFLPVDAGVHRADHDTQKLHPFAFGSDLLSDRRPLVLFAFGRAHAAIDDFRSPRLLC